MSLQGNATADSVLRGKINPIDTLVVDAYDIAVKHGFNGTEEEWLESLTDQTKKNAQEVIDEADKKIADMGEVSEAAKTEIESAWVDGVTNVRNAELGAVTHIEAMAEEYSNIVQTTGDSETAVMSQKAVTLGINNIAQAGKNIVDLSKVMFNGNGDINAGSGAVVNGTYWGWGRYALTVGETYTLSKTGTAVWLYFYEADGTYAGISNMVRLLSDANVYTFTANYPVVVLVAGCDLAPYNVQIELGNTATDYEPYCFKLNENVIIPIIGTGELNTEAETLIGAVNEITLNIDSAQEQIADVQEQIVDVQEQMGLMVQPGKNIVDLSKVICPGDGDINVNTGNIVSSSYWVYGDYALVVGETYTLSKTGGNIWLYFYNADGTYAGGGKVLHTSPTTNVNTFTANYPIMRIVTTAGGLPQFNLQIELGNEATEYEPYGFTLNENIRINIPDLPTGDEGSDIPAYWDEHLDEKIARIKQLQMAGGKDCFSFVAIADVHYPSNLGKRSPALAKRIMDECNIKFALCLGDMQTQAAVTNEEALRAEWGDIHKMFEPIRDKTLMALGNHDGAWGQLDKDGDGTISGTAEYYCYNFTPEELFDYALRRTGLIDGVHFDESGNGYYVDDTASKVRYIMLNTNAVVYEENADGTAVNNVMRKFQLMQSQYDMVIDALDTIPSDSWSVVIGSHCPLTKWAEGNAAFTVMVGVLSAYQNKTTYSGTRGTAGAWDYVSVNVDFSNAKGMIAGAFAGHMHQDLNTISGGVQYICIAADCCSDEVKYGTVGTATEQCFDVITVNKRDGKIYCTRIGAGENREFTSN